MHEFEFNLKKAQKDITIADHLMNVTHPLINDPKLLIACPLKISAVRFPCSPNMRFPDSHRIIFL